MLQNTVKCVRNTVKSLQIHQIMFDIIDPKLILKI